MASGLKEAPLLLRQNALMTRFAPGLAWSGLGGTGCSLSSFPLPRGVHMPPPSPGKEREEREERGKSQGERAGRNQFGLAGRA